MRIPNTILDGEQVYLDARYQFVCRLLKLFYNYYSDTGIISETEVNGDILNDFLCEYSKEIDDIIIDFEQQCDELKEE